MHSLPVMLRLAGRPVILLGDGDAAEAKRRLIERAGAFVVEDDPDARIAIVAIEDERAATAAVAQLRARGLLVNAVDRPALCDFTLPAIVERDPVLVAIGTGGASAGLAAALRQRLEALLPTRLGQLARALEAARSGLRAAVPDGDARRRALAAAMAPGAPLDPLGDGALPDPVAAVSGTAPPARTVTIRLRSTDPDDLTLREARWLAQADRVSADAAVPEAILARARADAARVAAGTAGDGLTVHLELPR